MNKQAYIQALSEHLSSLTIEEQQDILRDVEEHFREASQAGRSEESVIAQLGKPKAFAEMMIAETKVNRIQQATSLGSKLRAVCGALLAVLVLTPFNLIFVFLPLFFITLFIAMGWFAIVAIVVSVPLLCIVAPILMLKIGFHFLLLMGILFFTIGWCALAVAVMTVFYYVTLFYFKGISALFKWNLQFIKRSMRISK